MRGVLILALCVLASCTAVPARTVEKPELYPDRTSAPACWRTFLWAWRTGDVPVLEQTYGLWLREELLRQIETQGRAKVADFYKRDAETLVIEDTRWEKEGEDLAYLVARLGPRGQTPSDVRFAFLRRDDGWCVDARRTIR